MDAVAFCLSLVDRHLKTNESFLRQTVPEASSKMVRSVALVSHACPDLMFPMFGWDLRGCVSCHVLCLFRLSYRLFPICLGVREPVVL